MILRSMVVAFVLFVTALPAFAQERKVHGGVKAGVVWSTATGIKDSVVKGHMDGTGGAFLSVDVNEVFAFQPEGIYVRKGVKVSDPVSDTKIKLAYVEVPILARVSPQSSGPARVYFLVGPAFGMRLSAKAKTEAGGESFEQDLKDEVKKSEVSIVAGGGVQVGAFLVEARFQQALTKVNQDDQSIKTRSVLVLVGARF